MFGLPKMGDGLAIERLLRFFREHRIDTERLAQRSIAITGSNGKGSTARFCAAALQANGRSVGCFTSPHLFHVRERFVIDDIAITDADFDRHAKAVLAFNARLPEGGRMGAFEFLFLIAILWFEEKPVDAIVWEAGLGGRYDPVRTVRARVSALTSIELEHTQILGATEELIAYDKIDALVPGGTLIVSPSVPAHLHARIAAYCSLSDKKPCFLADQIDVAGIANHRDGVRFALAPQDAPEQTHDFSLSLIGAHQIDNALTAVRAACAWAGIEPDAAGMTRFLEPLAEVSWPGRLERVADNPDLWVDVGHTPNAIDRVTSAFLDIHPREKTLVVFGVSASKEVDAIAAIAANRFDHFILTAAHKAGAEVSLFRDHFLGQDVSIEPDIALAARRARERAAKEGWSVLALGGLFLAVEFEHAWRGGDPRELEFF